MAKKHNEKISLTRDQSTALSQLKKFTQGQEKFFRLTGFAGTGKTFPITSYIQWLIREGINACRSNSHQ